MQKGKGQHLGVQQLLVVFLVGRRPGILRTQVRDCFAKQGLAFEGIDRRLRELDERNLILRAKTNSGTSLRLSKLGQEEFDRYYPVFRDFLATSKKALAS